MLKIVKNYFGDKWSEMEVLAQRKNNKEPEQVQVIEDDYYDIISEEKFDNF